HRERDRYDGALAGTVRGNFQSSAELHNSFAHASHADAGRACLGYLGQFLGRYAFSPIADVDSDVIAGPDEAKAGHGTSRVAKNIGQAFLDDAEDGGFEILRKPAEVFGQVEINGNLAAFRKAFDVPAQGRTQAGFVEQRRVEQVGNGANFRTRVTDQSNGF